MPWIDLQGAVNVRDLGGLPTDDGGQTVVGRLLRADNLQELSPSDVSLLVRDIGLTTVVDLRSSAELASEGPAPLDAVSGVRHVHHPVVPEVGSATDVVAEALLLKKVQDRSRFPSDPTCGHYLGYLEDPRTPPSPGQTPFPWPAPGCLGKIEEAFLVSSVPDVGITDAAQGGR